MPRRRALTEAQLQTLFALPTTEANLIRHWTVGSDDLAAVGRRRRDHNRLGFALQMGWTAPAASMCQSAGCENRQKGSRPR